MTRKSSLLEISKAYEQVLEEMNIGIQSNAQNTIPFDQDEIETFMKSAEEMSQQVNSADQNKEKCSECENGQCSTHNQGQDVVIRNATDPNTISFVAPKVPEQPPQEEEENCEECEKDVYDSGNLDMAKSEIFKIKKYADSLFSLIDCGVKIEAWMLSKIVKAADYLCAVKNVVEFESYEKNVSRPMDDFSNDMVLVSKITSMLNGEGKEVNEEVLKRIIFNLEILKEIK